MTNVVEFNNVTKSFKNFSLDDVSFSIKKGYVTGFIGANGAGKSTTIKLLMNLLRKDSGNITIFGLDQDKHNQAIKERIGFVYDENCFYDTLSIRELRKIIAPMYQKWNDNLFYKYLDQFSLPEKQPIKGFSKGMKMKMAILFAISHDPEFIIMDEPTSGLDPVFRREVLELLHEIMLDEQKTIFFSTHITTDLDRIADYITYIHKGKILFSKEREELLTEYGIVKGSNDLLDRDTEKEFVSIRKTNVGFEALTSCVKKTKDIFGDEVLIEKPSLEDIMYYTNKGDLTCTL
ncbi:Vitamin B12 import ATP-binding protein BtuD [Neobacillus rhizosphaerae]|uniref:Vitamin B12 import ATP-binding protein BtuD n=1 Tax=Neobacillus rhizosphaerae TaxID=2880965 RepID=A0ABN8KY91_9BACI|nr:ABC transporter ATP-binding protein [Neobacillus rhizosphaerae]CAH2717435.1 Vitamin B12 import ATP-binding protein BtuD [Neobacillus rhizosphaerae]